MNESVLLTVASATEHPLLDIDLTVLIQLGIFTVTAFLASRLLFKPYIAMREQRDAGIEGARTEAEAMSAKAEAQLAEYEATLAAAQTRANEERRRIRSEAAEYQRKVSEEARVASQKMMEEAQQSVLHQSQQAKSELLPKADQLAGDIIQNLLGRKVSS